jgi:hypothetical protein
MAIGSWMRLRGRLRPWMVLVALAAPGAVGGCKKAERSTAGADGDAGSSWVAMSQVDGAGGAKTADACQQVALYGPAPACTTDEQCVEQHGAGWVCERGSYEVDDGCGGKIHWPTGACRPPAGQDAETVAPPSVDGPADAAVEPDAAASTPDFVEDRTAAEMAQRVRDVAISTRGSGRDVSAMASAYGVPDYGIPSPAVRGTVTPSGGVSLSGEGAIDQGIVLAQIRRRSAQVRACYDHALAVDPELAGTLDFDIMIAESGAVSASVARNDDGLQAAGVTDCVLARMRQASFAATPPQGGEVRARFGLTFRPAS